MTSFYAHKADILRCIHWFVVHIYIHNGEYFMDQIMEEKGVGRVWEGIIIDYIGSHPSLRGSKHSSNGSN